MVASLVAGMGLSVADPATLVTLNSLSPSNYDSAKSLGVWGKSLFFGSTKNLQVQRFLEKVLGHDIFADFFCVF